MRYFFHARVVRLVFKEGAISSNIVINCVTMYRFLKLIAISASFWAGCTAHHTTLSAGFSNSEYYFIDTSRSRPVPVLFFTPEKLAARSKMPVVIMSHGYNENEPGANRGYNYLLEFLARNGYCVVSMQHELPTDSLLPIVGKPQVVRRSNWERGAANILFVINTLKRTRTDLDFQHITLIGHSNGGDMSVLFAHQYPDLVEKVITLDHKRMLLPRAAKPKVLSLRADDFPADEGVLPSPAEQQQFGITIIQMPGVKHGDFSVTGSERQHREINQQILKFLKPD